MFMRKNRWSTLQNQDKLYEDQLNIFNRMGISKDQL